MKKSEVEMQREQKGWSYRLRFFRVTHLAPLAPYKEPPALFFAMLHSRHFFEQVFSLPNPTGRQQARWHVGEPTRNVQRQLWPPWNSAGYHYDKYGNVGGASIGCFGLYTLFNSTSRKSKTPECVFWKQNWTLEFLYEPTRLLKKSECWFTAELVDIRQKRG